MTAREMNFDFNLKLDKVNTLSKASFNPAEIDWLLNEAQLIKIKRIIKREFEINQKRIDDLKSLVISNEVVSPTLLPDINVYEFDLNDLAHTYLFFISGRALAKKTNCAPQWASLRFIQYDDLNYILNDPFNDSNEDEVIYNFGRSSTGSSSSMYIYPSTLESIDSLLFNYIKYPVRINLGGYIYIDGNTYPTQDCELPQHIHPEIVDIAVEIAAGIIEHPEYVQLKAQKAFKNE